MAAGVFSGSANGDATIYTIAQNPSGSPFRTRLLPNNEDADKDPNYIQSLCPASYITPTGNVTTPLSDFNACIEKELDLSRLTYIHDWLSSVGRPMPPRPLHVQLAMGRNITINERMDMHLVWTAGRIYIKPIPRFLLEPRFWSSYLSCAGASCDCTSTSSPCGRRRRALGFLFTYTALIRHESDFHIAREKRLLPAEATWPKWRLFVEELDPERICPSIDKRFYYGELRLGRLNKIYLLIKTPGRPYKSHGWDRSGAFFEQHFAWLATTTIYIVVVLTAMQVGLAGGWLAESELFATVSSGFAVFSILGPLGAGVLIVMGFVWTFLNHVHYTNGYRRRRLHKVSSTREYNKGRSYEEPRSSPCRTSAYRSGSALR